ncbi:hypothetical protein R1flu_009643 [Riccia fluitans]|uniref:Uncharacterized protein n=1 Tax=Riccia fluitans TaxID=41844 RepID=A0ABD1Z2Q3_9MARC
MSFFIGCFTDLEDCLEAIEDQLLSIKMQKETLEKPDPDEAFLKNELSLFLNVSSILPDLGDPKFSGTFVDKQKGVKAFKFSADSMSPLLDRGAVSFENTWCLSNKAIRKYGRVEVRGLPTGRRRNAV